YLKKILVENSTNNAVPPGLAVSYQMTIKQVKNIEDADFTYAKSSNKEANLLVVHKTVDPNTSHPLSTKMVLANVNQELLKLGIEFTPVSDNAKKTFNTHTFGLYIKFHNVKDNSQFAYKHSVGKTQSYTYSILLVQKIIDDIQQDPDIFINYKKLIEDKKKNQP